MVAVLMWPCWRPLLLWGVQWRILISHPYYEWWMGRRQARKEISSDVGIVMQPHFVGLQMRIGRKWFYKKKGCNAADLCLSFRVWCGKDDLSKHFVISLALLPMERLIKLQYIISFMRHCMRSPFGYPSGFYMIQTRQSKRDVLIRTNRQMFLLLCIS